MKTLPARHLLIALALMSGLVVALSLSHRAAAQAPGAPLAQACADSYEPDGSAVQAGVIVVNGPRQTHTLDVAGDEDWMKFWMTAGRVYTITTSNLISSTDTYLELYGEGTPRLAYNDDIQPGVILASQIVTTAAQSGTYYARVTEFYGRGGCSDYGYDLSVTSTPVTVYLPIVASPPKLAISGLEVTQSVQRADNGVSLVAGRRTMLRVYPYSLIGVPIGDVRISVAATSNGVALPGSPLVIGPGTAPASPSRATYPGFSVELPGSWLAHTIVITANAYTGLTPYPGVNSSLTLNFNVVPALDVMVVPIQYTHAPTGITYSAPPSNSTTASEIRDWIMRAYPVSDVAITFHTAVPFTGDLRSLTYWSNLLDIITYRKATEGGPGGRVYYGLIPTTDGGNRWFYSGYSGYGWVSYRAAIGLQLPTSAGWNIDQTGQTAAHEIGHNLSRYHAPCGGVSNPDQFYPYPGGSIGEYGLDIPKGILWNPASTFDLMGYCDPQWVSDYTYQGLYNDQRLNGASVLAAAAPGLLIRGVFSATGEVALKPVYALSLPQASPPSTSRYQAELLDAQGQVVAAYPVPVLEAVADPTGETTQSIHAVVPQLNPPAVRVRLVRGGQTVAEKTLAGAGLGIQSAPTVSGGPGGPITVTWSGADKPALVRYSADGGQTWTTLGVDVLGGQLVVDAATLTGGGAGQFDVTLAEP